MVGIYVRVSSEEQAKKGYSLKDQLHECRRKAPEGESCTEYIDDGVSGEFLDRPALNRLRTDIREGLIKTVICLDPDRLSRKLINQLILSEEIEKKAKLLFVSGDYEKTPEGRLFYQMKGAVSEYEKAKINERMSRGRRQKAREGKVVSDYSIYGYRYDKAANSLIPDPYESETVRNIFDYFTGRRGDFKGVNGIARYLTEKGIPTKHGAGVWHRQVVRQILMNRAYIGEFYQNKWNCEGILSNAFSEEERVVPKLRSKEDWILVPCVPLVEKEVFDYAQELLEQSRRRWAGRPLNRYLLGGLLRCGICGNTMTGICSSNWGKVVLQYTDRKKYSGAKNRGCGIKVKAEELDKDIWEAVCRILRREESIRKELAKRSECRRAERSNTELKTAAKRLGDIERSRRNLLDFLADSIEVDDKVREDINRRLAGLAREEMLLLQHRDELLSRKDSTGEAILTEAVEFYLSGGPGELGFDDRRALIRMLVKEIRFFPDRVELIGF